MLADYRLEHPKTRITTLEALALHILRPSIATKYDITAKRRARFYLNVILKKGR